jgi:hypothetical protein
MTRPPSVLRRQRRLVRWRGRAYGRGHPVAMRLTPEFRLLCLALRQPRRTEDIAALQELVAASPRWNEVIEGARRHRVATFLLHGMRASGSPQVPQPVLAELRRQAREAAQRSLAQVVELARLSRLFGEAGIRVLALKGVVLSAYLYGDLGVRDARDIDLLVDPEDFAAAERILIQSGYEFCGNPASPRQRAAYRHWIKEAEYAHAETGIRVELHHRLSDNPGLIPTAFATLWQEREEVLMGGAVVATLPRRYLGLYLCLHGASHCWERLCWLVDLAAALQAPNAVGAAIAAAETAGVGAPMLHALVLAHDWLALPVDDHHLARARAKRSVARLDRILAHFYAGAAWNQTPPPGTFAARLRYSLWLRLYTYSLKPDLRYRTRQIMREFVSPADWDAIPLPDRLFWLFPLLRPIGWLVRRARRG